MNQLELKIECWPPYPKNGLIVGTRNGVKITHRPTGISVISDCHRSQHRNRKAALEELERVLTETKKWIASCIAADQAMESGEVEK